MAAGEGQARKSDLGVRTLSAVVMVVVAGTALWLGGWVWMALVGAVAAGVLGEWRALVRGFARSSLHEAAWIVAGIAYIGIAAAVLMALRESGQGAFAVLRVISVVVAVDVGAFFAGRAIGGPRIAPRISPAKTWAGLFGGAVGAAAVLAASDMIGPPEMSVFRRIALPAALIILFLTAAIAAIVAQAGDFFESWMKRRAGVKDSGKLIPGHGGLFDRVDGLLAVLSVIGVFQLVGAMTAK